LTGGSSGGWEDCFSKASLLSVEELKKDQHTYVISSWRTWVHSTREGQLVPCSSSQSLMVQASICYGTDLSYVLCTHIVGKVTCLFLSFGVRQGGILSPRLVTIMFTLTSSSPDCRESRLHACLEKQFGLKFVMQMIIIVFIVTSSSTLQIYKTFASEIVSMLTRCI